MEKWYQQKFRRTLLDMHIEDWDDRFMTQFDPEAYFRALQDARVNAPMIYVQSHVGLCYWPTRTGVMHRGLRGREDVVQRLFRLCREAGMSTVLYYSIIYNNRESLRHPEWQMRDRAGRGSMDFGGRYGLCCPNNEDYRAFVLGQIEEFSEYFDFDGVFFDMTFWPEVCYCDACKKRWAAIARSDMPTIIDWNAPVWRQFNRARHDWIGEFAQLITQKAKECKPGITVEHQYGNSLAFWRYGNNENVSQASDYIGTDLYGGPMEQSFACKVWYELSQNLPFQYMTSRCYPSLSEHTTTKTKDQLRQCVAMTYLHHGAPLLIDAIDPVGTVDPRVYRLMGEIYEETQGLEAYVREGELAWDVSLYFDLNGKYDPRANGCDVLDPAVRLDAPEGGTMPHYDALRGAASILSGHHIPYGVINNWRAGEMHNHRVLVLADLPDMQPGQAEEVLRYLEQGGNVYISGHASSLLLEKVFGLTPAGYTEDTVTYMAPAQGYEDVMHGYFNATYPLIMFEQAARVTGTSSGEILATITLPYTPRGIRWSMFPTDIPAEQYVDPKGPRAAFSTIHANPPGIPTDWPALVRAKYGRGTALWSAMPIERADRFQHGEIFAGLIRMLAGGSFRLEAEGPASLECILFDAPGSGHKLVGIIETRQEAILYPTHGLTLRLRNEEAPKSVRDHLGREIPFTHAQGETIIQLETIDVYLLLVFQY